MVKRSICSTLLAVALLAVAGAPAPFAAAPEGGAPPAVDPVVAPVLPTGGCGAELQLVAEAPAAGACPAAQPASAGADFLVGAVRRTCRCSCGFPCTTNADCGLGGVCSPGITCC